METQLAFEIADELKNHYGLKIAHLNVNGLQSKLHEVKILLEECKFDIFGITETHLHKDISNIEVAVDGYQLIRKDRSNGTAWGGVVIYAKESLNAYEAENFAHSNLENICLECIVKSQKLIVSCIYQPPRNLNEFLHEFERIIKDSSKRTNVVFLGDFNIDLEEKNSSNYAIRRKFITLLQRFNLYNVVKGSTRITPGTRTQIDHIIVTNDFKKKVITVRAIDFGISDHHLVYCTVDLFPPRSKTTYKTVRNYRNVNVEQLKKDINSAPWHICDIFDDVDDVVFVWEHLYKNTINEHVPVRKVKVRAKSHPWMNGEIRKKLNERYKLLKKAQLTPRGSTDWNNYKIARNNCTKMIRNAESNYWRFKFRNVNSSNREFWRLINEFTGDRKSTRIGSLKNNEGVITNSSLEKSELLNEYFANVGKLQKIPENAELLQHYYRVTPTISQINYHPEKLKSCFQKFIKPGKSGGHDGITSKDILLIGEDILDGLHYVAKSSFTTMKFPTRYKTAKVTCIHKKGSKLKCENYRPISLLCLPGKLLEAFIASELDIHIYQHSLLSNHQWGFRKGRSPELMLLNLTEEWEVHLKNNQLIGVLLLDFSKAFDSVCHSTLSKKLQAIGISGDIHEWCTDYLSDRKQFTVIDGTSSTSSPVEQGVPQGSLLGPRFYSDHANDLPNVTSGKDEDSEMFADDTTGFCYSFDIDTLFTKLQNIADKTSHWSALLTVWSFTQVKPRSWCYRGNHSLDLLKTSK